MLLSFERPASPPALVDLGPRALAVRARLFSDLENCTVANDTGIRAKRLAAFCLGEIEDFSEREESGLTPGEIVRFLKGKSPPGLFPDHRQDSKGTWWMPWHQESMKGVNGCDKPR